MTDFIHLRGGDTDGDVHEASKSPFLPSHIEVDRPVRWQVYLPTGETYETHLGHVFIYDYHPEIFSDNDKQPDAFIGPTQLPSTEQRDIDRALARAQWEAQRETRAPRP